MSRETLREKKITEIVRQTPRKYFALLTEERDAAVTADEKEEQEADAPSVALS